MKKAKKILSLSLCALMLAGASIAGTVAYLNSQDTAVNTFTVGKVNITLKEYDVDPETGLKIDSPKVDELKNLKVVPGREIQKHPVVTVEGGSEACWLFVTVENGLETFEARGEGADTIKTQLGNHGWTPLEDNGNVYCRGKVSASESDQEFTLFEKVVIADQADTVKGWADITSKTITIKAYAIQAEGFDTASEAWEVLEPTDGK